MYALGGFITPYLMRYHHLDIAQANFLAMIVYGIARRARTAAGRTAPVIGRRRNAPTAHCSLQHWRFFSRFRFFTFSIGAAAGAYILFSVLMGAGCALMYFYVSIVYSTVADVTEPAMRGTAMAVYFLAMYFFGASIGPLILGMVSDHFTQAAAAAAGVTQFTAETLEPFRGAGLHSAVYIVPIFSAILTLVLFAASRTVKKDVERLNQWMRENAETEN